MKILVGNLVYDREFLKIYLFVRRDNIAGIRVFPEYNIRGSQKLVTDYLNMEYSDIVLD